MDKHACHIYHVYLEVAPPTALRIPYQNLTTSLPHLSFGSLPSSSQAASFHFLEYTKFVFISHSLRLTSLSLSQSSAVFTHFSTQMSSSQRGLLSFFTCLLSLQ